MDIIRKNYDNTIELFNENIEENIVPILKFPLIENECREVVNHCFSTRFGGVSKGIFDSMNLSFTRGDDEKAVLENFRRIALCMDSTPESIVCSNQTHTMNVMEVTKEHAGNGVIRANEFVDVDGMVTNEPGLVLATFYADCVPLYFIDKENKAIGLSHSGWRGTVGRIGRETIKLMKEKYGTKPENLICAIGPSICMECYEISREVADEFAKEFPEYVNEILEDKGNDKFLLDLWKVNEIILIESGVKRENIAITNICTCCNDKLLFSHRATKGQRGNLGAFLMLKKQK